MFHWKQEQDTEKSLSYLELTVGNYCYLTLVAVNSKSHGLVGYSVPGLLLPLLIKGGEPSQSSASWLGQQLSGSSYNTIVVY